MGFHLIKVCTDNCYYLISTIWKETMLIGLVWLGRKEKRNKCVLCFLVQISPLSGLCRAVSQTLMRSLFQDQSHLRLWENIHVSPHPPGSSAISLAETMHCIEDMRWTVVCMVRSSKCIMLCPLCTCKNIKTWHESSPSLCLLCIDVTCSHRAEHLIF